MGKLYVDTKQLSAEINDIISIRNNIKTYNEKIAEIKKNIPHSIGSGDRGIGSALGLVLLDAEKNCTMLSSLVKGLRATIAVYKNTERRNLNLQRLD